MRGNWDRNINRQYGRMQRQGRTGWAGAQSPEGQQLSQALAGQQPNLGMNQPNLGNTNPGTNPQLVMGSFDGGYQAPDTTIAKQAPNISGGTGPYNPWNGGLSVSQIQPGQFQRPSPGLGKGFDQTGGPGPDPNYRPSW